MPIQIRRILRAGALLGFALAVGGCATSYRFQVEAQRHPEWTPDAISYRLIIPGGESKGPDQSSAHASRLIGVALASKGMFPAPAGVQPQLEVDYEFTIGEPVTVVRVRKEPVPVFLFDEVINGERLVKHRETTCRKFLRLTARRMPSEADQRPPGLAWSIYVTNDDASTDAQRYLRLMVAAAMDLIGNQLGGERCVVLTDRDGRVLFIEQAGS